MAEYIERQGKAGERRMTRVNNRVGGYNSDPDRTYSRLCRRAAEERDERRIFSREYDALSIGLDDDDAVVTGDNRHCARYDSNTGVVIPVGGGVVFVGERVSDRAPRVVYGANGQVVAAHF